ncbi:MAG: hypothetical protein RID21_02810 [Gimesia sp.]
MTFEWEGHHFDLMLNSLTVDGKQYDWKNQQPIALVKRADIREL